MQTLHPTSLLRPAFAQGCGVLRVDAYNTLNYRILGGGYYRGITHRFFVKHRALASLFETPSSTTFQRCLRASLGGFIASIYYGNHLL